MGLGILFAGGNSLRDIVTVGRRAEAAGFDSLYMVEAYRSAWIALTALAGVTTRVQLGPYVANAYARSPLITGMSAVDFNEYANGRLVLGVGGGNRIINEEWQGIPHARVLTKLREYVEILQRIARTPAGQPLIYNGKVHSMSWTPVIAPTPTPYPVYLAAVFPAMLRVAAAVADGIAGGATLSPRYLREELLPRAARCAMEVDRDPGSLRWRAVMFTAVSADRTEARLAVRYALCNLFAPLPHPYYEYTMREQGFGPVVERLRELVPAGRSDAAIDAIPDALIDTLTIAGTPAECRARIDEYSGLVEELILLNAMPAPAGDPVAAFDELLLLAR